jgi:hypothetical protein
MKSRWIKWILLLLSLNGFSQQQDTMMIEDQYNAALPDENGMDQWNNQNVDINSHNQIKQLPHDLQAAILIYKSEFGCFANLQELYRIQKFTIFQWDSLIYNFNLSCEPCWERPKFIAQSIIITARDVYYPIDKYHFEPKYNIRYKGKSENGFRWGMHHFASNNNGEKETLTTGFVQLKRKNSHIILGDYLPQTPLHLLFGNNLMNSTSWNVSPVTANAQFFLPYTSSIPNRHWRGAGLSTTLKTISIKLAIDVNTDQNLIKPKQRWASVDWKGKKINIQYHYYDTSTLDKSKNRQALSASCAMGKGILQAESSWQIDQVKINAHWIQPVLKNQWMRLSYQVDQSPILIEEQITYVHQIFFHKKWKGLISVDQENSKGIWESAHDKGQTLRTQLDYMPTRYHLFYLRYQVKKNPEITHQWRCDGQWKIGENSKAHCRIEQHIIHHSLGWLSAVEYEWKPMNKRWQIVIRQIFFAIPDWDLRIYMIDRELQGGMSIPAYNGKGKRTFLIAQYQHQSWRWAIKIERHNPHHQERSDFINLLDVQLAYSF